MTEGERRKAKGERQSAADAGPGSTRPFPFAFRLSPFAFLLWCAPALVLGLVLRVLMASAMPFAYVQHDSYRLLLSGAEWLVPGAEEMLGENVPFLVPALYRLARSGPFPALMSIQLAQHALGVMQIVLAGVLVRCWLPRWKWWIVPATLVIAAHPSFLWYEHTVMLEAAYVFAVMLLAVAGTWLLRHPSLAAAAGMCAALVLIAFTRPEGKIFAAFGALAIAVAFWKDWRRLAAGGAMFAGAAVAITSGTVPGESGLLLYSSVLHLSPESPRSHPAAAPYVAALRGEAVEAAKRGPAFVSRPQRQALNDALMKFVAGHPDAGRGASDVKRMNSVAEALAFETCLRAPHSLPGLAMDKFRESAGDLANGKLSEAWLHERQISRLRSGWRYIEQIDVPLYGRDFSDADALAVFVKEKFPPDRVRWFGWLHEEWRDLYDLRLPDSRFAGGKLPGLPLFYLLPLAGMIAAIAWPLASRRFHVCWIAMLASLWFVIMLSANERSRFRMGFEPFIFLYPFVAFDCAAVFALRARKR